VGTNTLSITNQLNGLVSRSPPLLLGRMTGGGAPDPRVTFPITWTGAHQNRFRDEISRSLCRSASLGRFGGAKRAGPPAQYQCSATQGVGRHRWCGRFPR